MTRPLVTLASVFAMAAIMPSSLAQAQSPKSENGIVFVTEQPASEWLAHVMFGAIVQNASGEVIGDVNDLVFNRAGQISTVVLGIGGTLGLGEKNVAVPYSAVTFKSGADGARAIVVPLTKDELKLAPAFKATEKTTYDAMKDKAVALGKSASDKAGQLKDQAMKKIEDMKADSPKKQ